jgi:hypothetical protein
MQMRTLFDSLVFVVWVTAYLGVAYAIAGYRRTRANALGGSGRDEYRATKDVGLRVIVFLVGILLAVGAFYAGRAFG